MKTRFFRFPDEKTFQAKMPGPNTRIADRMEKLPEFIKEMSILGTLYKQPVGELPPVPYTGFHVNTMGDSHPTWAQYEVFPVTPNVIFGDDYVAPPPPPPLPSSEPVAFDPVLITE